MNAVSLAFIMTGVLLNAAAQQTFPRLADAGIDLSTLVFTVVIAAGTGLVFTLIPAVQGSRGASAETLKGGAHGSTTGGKRLRLRPRTNGITQ